MKPSEVVSWLLNILLVSVIIILSFKLQVPKYESAKPVIVTETAIKEVPTFVKVRIPVIIRDTITTDTGDNITVVASDTTHLDADGNSITVSYFYPPYDFFDIQADIKTKEITNTVYQDKEIIKYAPQPIEGWKRIRPAIQLGGGAIYTDKQLKLGWYLGVGISYILW
jgi:hypothetical protein